MSDLREPGPDGVPEQGVLAGCAYCSVVRPGLGGECPLCQGRGPRFRAARMMDGPTSRAETLRRLTCFGDPWQGLGAHDCEGAREAADEVRRRWLGLLEDVLLYGFDLRQALIERILETEARFDLEPGQGDAE